MLLARGVPRAWLADGQVIRVARAPTCLGPLSYEIRSRVAAGEIQARIEPPRRNPPAGMRLRLRLRHPDGKPIAAVTVNGRPWRQFDRQTITLEGIDDLAILARF